MYKNYEHFTLQKDAADINISDEVNSDEYKIETEDLIDDENVLDLDEPSDLNTDSIEIETTHQRKKKGSDENNFIKVDDFDKSTDLIVKKAIKQFEKKERSEYTRQVVHMGIYVLIGILVAIIFGYILISVKETKIANEIEIVEPPRLY